MKRNTIAIGDSIAAIDPRTGKQSTGTVKWVSPTHKSYAVTLADGFTTYAYSQEV